MITHGVPSSLGWDSRTFDLLFAVLLAFQAAWLRPGLVFKNFLGSRHGPSLSLPRTSVALLAGHTVTEASPAISNERSWEQSWVRTGQVQGVRSHVFILDDHELFFGLNAR